MLTEAIRLAIKIQSNKYRLVAIITDAKDRILTIGVNSYTKSHPRQYYYACKCGNSKRIFLHAEISAIINLKRNDKPAKIYVARVNKKEEVALAKPCAICMEAIKDVGIKELYYTQ